MAVALATPPAVCMIEPNMNGASMTLTAKVAALPQGGSFEFKIKTVSPDGSSSSNMQGGEIDAGQPGNQVLGTVVFGHPLRNWSAQLTVYAVNGSPLCDVTLP